MLKLCSIYDNTAKTYYAPFTQRTTEQAQRSVKQGLQQPNSEYAAFPETYSLFHLADYNEETGEIFPLPIPYLVANLKELVTLNQ